MSYIAANGQEITEAMIGSWCDAYERGEFPEGERTVGEVVMGRPPSVGRKDHDRNGEDSRRHEGHLDEEGRGARHDHECLRSQRPRQRHSGGIVERQKKSPRRWP